MIAAALYFGLRKEDKERGFLENFSSPTVLPTPLPSFQPTSTQVLATPTPTLTPTLNPTQEISWTKSDLLAALAEKTGIPEEEIEFSVGEELKKEGGVLLRGGVSRRGEMGGAAFFAVVDETGVRVTFAGQGVPQCSEVDPYGYPFSWADYCVDEGGNTVRRQ